jgi:hypothetical protein
MDYRVLYDVRDDSWTNIGEAGGAVGFLGVALLWTVIWSFAYRAEMRKNPDRARKMRFGLVLGLFFIILGTYLAIDRAIPAYEEYQRCRQWLDDGNNQVTEGVIAEVSRGVKGPSRYRIGDAWFGGSRTNGGFRSSFTAEDAKSFRLEVGMSVRFTTREGRILRVEVAK